MLASVDTGNIPCIVDPHIWWRHPMLRLVAVWSILFLDFFIYGVDPAQDSHVTYPFFGVFEDFFIIAWPQRVEHQISRIVLFIVLTMFSFWFGRMVVHHKFLRDFCGLQMFSENNGTLLVNFIVYVIFFEGVLPLPVNYIESGSTAEPVTEHSVLRYMDWGKIWQTMAAVADTLAIVTITDAVMQDRTVWPDFAPRVKWLWNDAAGGWVRVLMAWTGFVIMMPLIVFGLWCDDRTNGIYTMDHVDVLRTTQWMRVAVAAFLTCVDITTCLQDWEFPSFNAPLDFKIVGSFATTIDIQCLTDLTRPISKVITCIPEDFWEVFHFRMSGKWLAYMPAFGSLGVDLYYMIRTIYSFKPIAFGEYVKDCRLFVIVNETFLDSLYLNGAVPANESDYPSWENRQGEGDVVLNSRFCGSHDALSAMFLGFGLFAGIAFIALIIRAEYYWDNYFTRNQEGLHDRINTYYEEAAEKQRQGSEGELGAQE
ncbi:unnamed protein product [Prorocentrum cordatum]|uniref:Uncharacterized protein n=1 Tax=Prorocentrum cordatum TaxID=2364126 RepID=A0ABN9XI51_9DINO|nr:unnamed protein product [Polarella glacialis]